MLLTINSGTLTKSHNTDAGFDIHASKSHILYPNAPEPISTNLIITLPHDTVAFIKPRSGLSFKWSINTMAGVIDQDYSGEIKVLLINHASEPYKINKGDRIAQLVILPVCHPKIKTLNDAIYNAPLDSIRDTKGFGSTGD